MERGRDGKSSCGVAKRARSRMQRGRAGRGALRRRLRDAAVPAAAGPRARLGCRERWLVAQRCAEI